MYKIFFKRRKTCLLLSDLLLVFFKFADHKSLEVVHDKSKPTVNICFGKAGWSRLQFKLHLLFLSEES